MLAEQYSLGIAIGNTNTVAVLCGPDGAEQPLTFDGANALPSAVCLDADQQIVVGRPALDAVANAPSAVELSVKRCIGDDNIVLDGRPIPVQCIVNALFRTILDRACSVAGGPVSRIAVAHPEGWRQVKKDVLINAVKSNDALEPLLLSEPEAAMQSLIESGQLSRGDCVLMYRLGGTSFSTGVLEYRENVPMVRIYKESEELGMAPVDWSLATELIGVAGGSSPLRTADDETMKRQRISRTIFEVRTARERLSGAAQSFVRDPQTERDFPLGRDQVEKAADPIIGKTVEIVSSMLSEAKLQPIDITRVLLVGGGTRMPIVQRRLHEFLGRPAESPKDPTLIIAEGAARALDRLPPPTERPSWPDSEDGAQQVVEPVQRRERHYWKPLAWGAVLLVVVLAVALVVVLADLPSRPESVTGRSSAASATAASAEGTCLKTAFKAPEAGSRLTRQVFVKVCLSDEDVKRLAAGEVIAFTWCGGDACYLAHEIVLTGDNLWSATYEIGPQVVSSTHGVEYILRLDYMSRVHYDQLYAEKQKEIASSTDRTWKGFSPAYLSPDPPAAQIRVTRI